jgi:hypothetical protein
MKILKRDRAVFIFGCAEASTLATDEGVKQPWPIRLSRGIALFQPTVLVVVLGGRDSADHAYRVIRVNR